MRALFILLLSASLAFAQYTPPPATQTVNSAGGVLTITGPTGAHTITVPDANFTVARTDAAQTFTGTQTFSGAVDVLLMTPTGNVIEQRIGTTAQIFKVYTTYASGSDLRYLGLEGNYAGSPAVLARGLGASANPTLYVGTVGNGDLVLVTNGGGRWDILGPTGHLLAEGAYNITTTGNLFAATGTFSGAVTIGGGTAIAKVMSATATLDFGSTVAGASTDLTITVTGAALNDVVDLGVPHGSTLANGVFTGWVSATDTVTVRFTNPNLVTALDPASGTFRTQVTKF